MNRKFLMAVTFFGITACATSTPDTPQHATNAEEPVMDDSSTVAVAQVDVPEVEKAPIPTSTSPRNGDEPVCRL